jgi:Tol biopolymer transport system component
MYLQRKHLYYSSFILFLIFIMFGLNNRSNINLKGKFVIDCVRNKDGVYIFEKGNFKLLTTNAGFPKWSNDGKKIGCISQNKIFIFNAKNRNLSRTIDLGYCQILPFVWSHNDTFLIIPIRVFADNFYNYYLIKYNLQNDRQEILYEFLFKNVKFNVKNLCLAGDNKSLAFFAGSNEINSYMYFLNIVTTNVEYLWKDAYPIGWLPDNKNLVFFANNDRTGVILNEGLGSILKMNVFSGTKTVSIVENFTFIDSQNIRLSRDGKYLYYSKRTGEKGYQIMISKLGQRDTFDEEKVTSSFFINRQKGYSKDMEPDWYF